MLRTKLLLISLFTSLTWLGLQAQTVNVHGTVTNMDGTGQPGVNIMVTAFYADSTVEFESVYTLGDGTYAVEISAPPINFLGYLQVSMVDCQGNIVTQEFVILNSDENITADFLFCEQIIIDSCLVYILEEWVPGSLPFLSAWTPENIPVEYLWSTGDSSQTIYPSVDGEYCVTVTFPWGCMPSDCYEFTLDSFNQCFTYIVSTLNSDGTYNLEAVSFGVPPFWTTWSNGESGSVIDSVGPGTYCVYVVDSDSCVFETCVVLNDINFCEAWIFEYPQGGLEANGFGLAPFSYLWDTGETSQTIYPDSARVYCVTVTDQNQCTASTCYDYDIIPDSCFTYISLIYVDSTTLGLQAFGFYNGDSVVYEWNTGETGEIIYPTDFSQTYCVTMTDNLGCVGTACFELLDFCYSWTDIQYVDTSTAILTVYTDPVWGWGGNNSGTYVWSTGDTSQVITVTESGTYCVTATFGIDCVTETCVYVDFDSLQYSCSAWVIQYPDSSGQWYAEALVWGLGDFSYLWTTGDSTKIIPIELGEYTCVTATSSFGCEATACVDTFFNPCELYIIVDYISNDAAVLTAYPYYNQGNNYTYVWDNGQTGPILTVNQTGTYCVTITGGGCTSTACVDVYFWNIDTCGVWINSEPAPSGGILYTANAWGIPPFTYSWSNGATEQSQIVDFGIHDLCVTVTDSIGCVATACNFLSDSCQIDIWYSNQNNVDVLNISSLTPINFVLWSTGDTNLSIIITEPGTYCATVTDIFGCDAVDCFYFDTINQQNNVINGFVYADSIPDLTGWVFAYYVNTNGGPFPVIDSAVIGDNNFYSFTDMPAGLYLLQAKLTDNTQGADQFMPTYHLSTPSWQTADPYVLPNLLPVTTDIWMLPIDTMNGSGVIGGFITDPQHITAQEGEEFRGSAGLPGVIVFLKDAQGNVINYTISLEDGSFRFTGLHFGTYRITYEIAGLHSPEVWVTLTPAEPEKLQVTLVVNNGTVKVEEPTYEELELYPNPAKDDITVKLPSGDLTYHIQVIDMQGRIVERGSVKSNNGIMLIEVGQYSPGLYHINLEGENSFYFGRFVKQE